MNKVFLYKIFRLLSKAIDEGYKAGVKSIEKKPKTNFTAGELQLFAKLEVKYTEADKEAIKNFKINAFKVAGVGSYQLEEELKELAAEYKSSETPDYTAYEIAVRQKMLEYGIGLGDQPPSGWIKQNLDHAIKSSIAGARWKRATDPSISGLYKVWVYKTQKDDRVRDEHVVMDERRFRLDDSTGSKLMPPNDWGCRCYAEYETAEEAGDKDISSPSDSKELLQDIPEEFRYNPGVDQDIWNRWLDQKLADMPDAEVSKLNGMLREEFKK